MTIASIGQPVPEWLEAHITFHAVTRLTERFPELEVRDERDAREIIWQCLRTGRLLRDREVKRLFVNTFNGSGVFVYSTDLKGMLVGKLEGSAIVVKTVLPVRPHKHARHLFEGE